MVYSVATDGERWQQNPHSANALPQTEGVAEGHLCLIEVVVEGCPEVTKQLGVRVQPG